MNRWWSCSLLLGISIYYHSNDMVLLCFTPCCKRNQQSHFLQTLNNCIKGYTIAFFWHSPLVGIVNAIQGNLVTYPSKNLISIFLKQKHKQPLLTIAEIINIFSTCSMWIRGFLKTLVRLPWRCLEICYPHCWMVPKVAAFFLVDTYQHSTLPPFLPKLPPRSTANSACSVLYRLVFSLSTFLGANLYHWPHHSSSRSWATDYRGRTWVL